MFYINASESIKAHRALLRKACTPPLRSKQFTACIQKTVARIFIAFASGQVLTNRLGTVFAKSVDYLNVARTSDSERGFNSLNRRYAFADDFRHVAHGLSRPDLAHNILVFV